jgi:hypothetical protein
MFINYLLFSAGGLFTGTHLPSTLGVQPRGHFLLIGANCCVKYFLDLARLVLGQRKVDI